MKPQTIIDYEARHDAARAMLAALLAVQERFGIDNKKMRVVDDAIAQAEACGITG